MKVAVVGCGQIADAHLQTIRSIPGAHLVAVCDQYRDLAEQAAARFDVAGVFDDVDRLLSQARPEVVHITTPPQTHLALAVRALQSGVHVYLEKPFAVNVAETDEILAAARASRRLICVGHDQLFDPAWEECRQLVQKGDLGKVVHVDAILGYDLSGPFGKVAAADPNHWVHRLPGGLFQNTISHALYKITDFLLDEEPRLWAAWFGRQGAAGCPTELRVYLQGAEVTAQLFSSSAARPVQRVTRVYGTRRTIEVDLDGRLLHRYPTCASRGPFVKLELPLRHLREAAGTLRKNLWRFLRRDLHYFTGMQRLFTKFYHAIRDGREPPISYGEIRRLTAIMDRIFSQCQNQTPRLEALSPALGGEGREMKEVALESASNGGHGLPWQPVGATVARPGNERALPGASEQ